MDGRGGEGDGWGYECAYLYAVGPQANAGHCHYERLLEVRSLASPFRISCNASLSCAVSPRRRHAVLSCPSSFPHLGGIAKMWNTQLPGRRRDAVSAIAAAARVVGAARRVVVATGA